MPTVYTKPDAASVNVPSRESVSAEARPSPPDSLDREMMRDCNRMTRWGVITYKCELVVRVMK